MKHLFAILRASFISLAAGYLLIQLQGAFGSTYLVDFLKSNLLTLLVALLAINSATLGIVLTKLREIIDNGASNSFEKVRSEMRLSVFEHIGLIVLSLVLFTLVESRWGAGLAVTSLSFLHSCIAGIFCYSLYLLYDAANSVFMLLRNHDD